MTEMVEDETRQAGPIMPDSKVTMRDLRDAIPSHCFQPSGLRSAVHIVVDLILACGLALLAHTAIPSFSIWSIRGILWAAYGYLQGLIFTGIWILAHECGHEALFKSKTMNDCMGFVLHTFLLVPFFSWKYTHARHHRYTNDMARDTAFVPRRDGEDSTWSKIADAMGDSPVFCLFSLIAHQLLGWHAYLFFYASGGPGSQKNPVDPALLANSHFDPTSSIFTKSERPFVFLSAVGIMAVLYGLWQLASSWGLSSVVLLYGLPYLWTNHWLVAITYLHHTHPSVPHYETQSWTYLRGALGTVDRPFGFVGKYLFHSILDLHVIHHLFPRIPFYHAKEATEAIKPILGCNYIEDRTPIWRALWKTFRSCISVQEVRGRVGMLEWKNQ